MGGIDQIDMVSMLPSLILIKNEGFWMIWDGFELFGVDCESKFFRGFFMIFVSHKIFFLILFFKAEVWIFLSIMVYFDVNVEIYTFTFACGVVFSNGTYELAGKTTIYRKVFWMGKFFFQQNEEIRWISYWKMGALCAMRVVMRNIRQIYNGKLWTCVPKWRFGVHFETGNAWFYTYHVLPPISKRRP